MPVRLLVPTSVSAALKPLRSESDGDTHDGVTAALTPVETFFTGHGAKPPFNSLSNHNYAKDQDIGVDAAPSRSMIHRRDCHCASKDVSLLHVHF